MHYLNIKKEYGTTFYILKNISKIFYKIKRYEICLYSLTEFTHYWENWKENLSFNRCEKCFYSPKAFIYDLHT